MGGAEGPAPSTGNEGSSMLYVTVGSSGVPGRDRTAGWDVVSLGITVPRSYFCICCLTFDGQGMHRNGVTYCLGCWESRQQGNLCGQEARLLGPEARVG